MPILHVQALPQTDPKKIQTALSQTCLAIADAYGCSPKYVWATWEEIKSGHYVEGGTASEGQPLNTHPPVARLTCFEGKSPEEIENILLTAARTLGKQLGIANNIFMSYNEIKSGRVISGDGIVKVSPSTKDPTS